ncbi:MAG TPA: Rieske 2Fe-2S domain-containing protein, partial [Reyranella sp.]
MAEQDAKPSGPDLSQGVAFTDLADGGMLLGHVGDEQVVLARHGAELFAVGAQCSHYHGPLAEGLLVGDTVRCPWHHACFSLRTGEALAAPAFSAIDCWSVEQRDGKVFVKEKRPAPAKPSPKLSGKAPDRVVIVGGGAAGFAAAEMLRREQYKGGIVMLSSDDAAP